MRVLIADDEKNILSGLRLAYENEGFDVLTAEDGKEAWDLLSKNHVDLVITDLRMPGISGEELVRKITSSYPTLPVIVLTGHGTIENAVESMRDGAVDFLTKPVDIDKLLLISKKSISNSMLKEQNRRLEEEIAKLKSEKQEGGIIGSSPQILNLLSIIKQVAPTKASVLIEGESGTGKELVADSIVRLSDRANKPFIKVHCASLSPTLLESELFGHEKGAFTGAISDRKGRFELAHTGTIFLDEIGEIDKNIQVKLLRVLQERSFERVGSEKTIEVDVRIIAATNKNLLEEVKKGNFREDLYYRLAVVEINVPPLRERKGDVELLLNEFLAKFSREMGKNIKGFSPKAKNALMLYKWPGNVRELRNAIEASVVLADGERIEWDDLPHYVKGTESNKSVTLNLPASMEDIEKKAIYETIKLCHGNKSKAAELLKIGRKTIHRKLSQWGERDA